ncbi:hypothetical protein M8818_006071 [Zalaria obscura]|uniref:Uncharacterized protein n=1 Tax=Zalaria obscura TaxID=2024903 RepID=A0ACC3S8N5_9PEZI
MAQRKRPRQREGRKGVRLSIKSEFGSQKACGLCCATPSLIKRGSLEVIGDVGNIEFVSHLDFMLNGSKKRCERRLPGVGRELFAGAMSEGIKDLYSCGLAEGVMRDGRG